MENALTLKDWLKTIAFALNDDEPNHEFTRYPVDKLLAALNAARCLGYKYREDLFTEWRIVKLEAGKYQDVRGCCDKVLEVSDQTDIDGNIIKELLGSRKTTTTVKRRWNKPSCINRPFAPDGYVIDNASLDKNMSGRFEVSPPVPCDVDAYVRVKCVSGPCPLDETHLNEPFGAGSCDLTTAAWYFVLARMQAGDRFSNGTVQNMQYNHRMFFDILGVVQRQEDRIDSPQEAT